MNEKMMNEGHEYFANQEEEISNKFMSANGEEVAPIQQPQQMRKFRGLPPIYVVGYAPYYLLGGIIIYYLYNKNKK
jgi:hypothetical protein